MVKAELLKPLDGREIGAMVDFDRADFDRLVLLGAVKMADAPANKAAPRPANKAGGKKGAANV